MRSTISVVVEPTDASFQAATAAARAGKFDSFVAVGGGSTIDTAKAANLYSTHAAAFFDFVNAPIGRGLPIPGPLKPLIAIPTTAGTGSETTGVAIFDYVEKHAKTGIAHRYLKPTLGIVDSDNTRTSAGRGCRVGGSRRAEPCARVLHGDSLHFAAAAGPPARAARLSGLQSGE